MVLIPSRYTFQVFMIGHFVAQEVKLALYSPPKKLDPIPSAIIGQHAIL